MLGAIITAVKFLGAFVSAVNAAKALKEGNITKALISGVGAYMAFSGLGATTATQQAAAKGAAGVVDPEAAVTGKLGEGAATTAGTTAGAGTELTEATTRGLGSAVDTKAATTLADQTIEGGAFAESTLGRPPVESTGGFLGSAPEQEFLSSSEAVSDLTEAPSTAYESKLQESAGEGLLSRVGAFAERNPELTKIGGQMISGYAKQKQAEELRRQQLKMQKEERQRRGRSAGASAGSLKY